MKKQFTQLAIAACLLAFYPGCSTARFEQTSVRAGVTNNLSFVRRTYPFSRVEFKGAKCSISTNGIVLIQIDGYGYDSKDSVQGIVGGVGSVAAEAIAAWQGRQDAQRSAPSEESAAGVIRADRGR